MRSHESRIAFPAWRTAGPFTESNSPANVPMLRVNDTLGFVKQPESLTFQKDL